MMSRLSQSLAVMAALTVLGGCQSLPHDGPSPRSLRPEAPKTSDYNIVDLDYRITQLIAANPARPLAALAPASSSLPVDLIGEGDVLSVSIFQAASGPVAGSNQSFVDLHVDRNGAVAIPFAGNVRVAGLDRQAAAAAIREALRGRAVNPQVQVNVTTNLSNSVTVMGEVRNAGRQPLSANNDRLLDILAATGGPTKPAPDTTLTLVRGGQSVSTRLSVLMDDASQNVRLAPRDQIRLVYRPRKFSTFGAFARASQVTIEDDELSLAGAISRMGGLDINSANASSVLVFRFERPQVAQALGLPPAPNGDKVAVIYRLNLRDPTGVFVADRFKIEDQDLIYVPRADSTELKGFFELVTSITRVAYDLTVSNILP